jgi:DNA-binding transcriptional regulator PaaX
MSILKDLLFTVSNYPGGYRVIYDLIYKEKGSGLKEQSVRNTLSRMKKKGLISNHSGVWSITEEGKELLKKKKSSILKFSTHSNGNKKRIKTTIIIFDIPENKRLYRDWLRSELIGFGFELVQKSVWFGPSLPKEFVLYLDEIKILTCIRFFKVTEKDLI